MNEDNFKNTLTKKLKMDYEKGKLNVDDEFTYIYKALQTCVVSIDFTDKKVEDEPDAKQAILRLQIPLEQDTVFAKFKPHILSVAKDLFGLRDGYVVSDLEFDLIN